MNYEKQVKNTIDNKKKSNNWLLTSKEADCFKSLLTGLLLSLTPTLILSSYQNDLLKTYIGLNHFPVLNFNGFS